MARLRPFFVVTGAIGRPVRRFPGGGQTSGHIGARALVRDLPKATTLLADRGYVARWFRNTLKDKEIAPCIPVSRP